MIKISIENIKTVNNTYIHRFKGKRKIYGHTLLALILEG